MNTTTETDQDRLLRECFKLAEANRRLTAENKALTQSYLEVSAEALKNRTDNYELNRQANILFALFLIEMLVAALCVIAWGWAR